MFALETLLKRYVEWFDYDLKAIRLKYCPITDPACIGDVERFEKIYKEEFNAVYRD